MARQDLAYAITVNDAQLKLATRQVAAFNAELQASTVVGRKVDESLRAVGRRSVQVGNFFTRNLTIPLGLAAVASAKMAADFETSVAKIGGITNTTAADTQRLAKSMLNLGSTTIVNNFSDLADAVFELQSVGFRTNQTITAMGPIAKASAAGLGSIRDVADAVASSLDAYGIAGQTASRNSLSAAKSVAVLIGTINAGKLPTDELAGAMGRAIPIANALGLSYDQLGAAIAATTRQGLNANLAVTGIRALLSQIQKAQPVTQRALASIGTGPSAVIESIRDPKIGLLPTLIALRTELDKIGDKPVRINFNTLAAGLGGNALALQKVRAEVGSTNQAMAKLFPNIRALTEFLVLTGPRRSQTASVFSQLAFDAEHSQEVIKRAYEAKLKTPIGQLQLQLSKLRATGIEVGHSFIQVGADFLRFVNGITSAAKGANDFLQKVGPLGGLIKDLGLGLLLFGPVTSLFGRLVQAASLGVTIWGRWQVAATKAAYAIRGINIEQNEALIAERKATVEFVAGYNNVASAADRAAASIGRVSTASNAGVRGGILAASGGAAALSRASGGRKLSRGAQTTGSAGLSTGEEAALGGAALAVIEKRRALDVASAAQTVTVAQDRYNAAVQTAIPNQIALARAELDRATTELNLAKTNQNLLFPSDAKLLQMTRDLTIAEKELQIAQQQGVGISIAASRVANLNAGIRERQAALSVVPTGFGAFDQRTKLLQTRLKQEAAVAAAATQQPLRIMTTNFGTAIQGMRSTAKLGLDFIALTFATDLVGKVIFDSHKTHDAVTHDLLDIRKVGIATFAALALGGSAAFSKIRGFQAIGSDGKVAASGLTALSLAMTNAAKNGVSFRTKLGLVAGGLLAAQASGLGLENTINSVGTFMLTKGVFNSKLFTSALRGIGLGALAGKGGIIGLSLAIEQLIDGTHKGRTALGNLDQFFADHIDKHVPLIGHWLSERDAHDAQARLGKIGESAKKNLGDSVNDELFKQLENGLDRTLPKVGTLVKQAEAARRAGKEAVAETLLQQAQAQQLTANAVNAANFLRQHGHDELANILDPVNQQIKTAQHQFDMLFNNIGDSITHAFEARTDRMLDSFDRKTDNVLSAFDDKTQSLEDKLTTKVKLPNETFTIKVNGKTPAERELDALNRIQEKRQFQRDLFDSRQALGTAELVGDPAAIRSAERDVQDAQLAQQKFGLEARAKTERTAADKALDNAKKDLDKRRKIERQAIEDQRADLRRSIEATRQVAEDNLKAALAGEQTLFQKGKISLSTYKKDVQGIMRRFNVSIEQAGKEGGKAYADQMSTYFDNLTKDIQRNLNKIDKRANDLTTRLRNLAQGIAAINADERTDSTRKAGSGAAAAAAAAAVGNPITNAKIAAGIPTRDAILSAMRVAHVSGDAPQQGRPSKQQYEDWLKRYPKPLQIILQRNLREQGFFGANTGAVVPGRGNTDSVPALLTPGEIVLNKRQQSGLASRLGMTSDDPHTLFSRISRFASGGVVGKKKPAQHETLSHAILRMRDEEISDGKIALQIHRWNPTWTPQQISYALEHASGPGRTQGHKPGAFFLGLPTDYGMTTLFDPKHRGADRPVDNLHVGDSLGVVGLFQSMAAFAKHPNAKTAANLGLNIAGFVPLPGARFAGGIGRLATRTGLRASIEARAFAQARKGFLRSIPQTYREMWEEAFWPGGEGSVAETIRNANLRKSKGRDGLGALATDHTLSTAERRSRTINLLRDEKGQLTLARSIHLLDPKKRVEVLNEVRAASWKPGGKKLAEETLFNLLSGRTYIARDQRGGLVGVANLALRDADRVGITDVFGNVKGKASGAELISLATTSNSRGVGRQLVQKVMGDALKSGASKLELLSSLDGETFYEHLGFQRVGGGRSGRFELDLKSRGSRFKQALKHLATDETGALFLGREGKRIHNLIKSGQPFYVPYRDRELLPKKGFAYHSTMNEKTAQAILDSGKLLATSAERSGGFGAPPGAFATTEPGAYYGRWIVAMPNSAVRGQFQKTKFGVLHSGKDVNFNINRDFAGLPPKVTAALNDREVQIFGQFEPKEELYPEAFNHYRSLGFRGQAVEARKLMANAQGEIHKFAERLGLKITDIRPSLETWRGEKNIGYGIHVSLPKEGYSREFQKKVKALSSYVGHGFKQGSLSFGRPLASGAAGPDVHPGVFWSAGGKDIAQMQAKLDAAYGEGMVGIMSSPVPHGYYVVNFGDADAGVFTQTIDKLGIKGHPISWQGNYVYDRHLPSYGSPGAASFQTALHKKGIREKASGALRAFFADESGEVRLTREARAQALGLRRTPSLLGFDAKTYAKETRAAAAALGLKTPEDLAGPKLLRELRRTGDNIEHGWELNWDWYLRKALITKHIAELSGVDALLLGRLSNYSIQTAPSREIFELSEVARAIKAGKPIPKVGIFKDAKAKKTLETLEEIKKHGLYAPAGERPNPRGAIKTFSYGANTMRNISQAAYEKIYGLAEYVTLDRHHTRAQLPSRHAKGQETPGAAYHFLEQMFTTIARHQGVNPEVVQAAWWLPVKAENELRLAAKASPGRQNLRGLTLEQQMQLAADAGEAGFKKAWGEKAFEGLLKDYVKHGVGRSLNFDTPFRFKFASGGSVPGSGRGDTVPAMLTPGEIVLNRQQQSNLSSMLGLGNVSPDGLFTKIAQRFALGGVVQRFGPGGVVSENGQGMNGPILPRLRIDGLEKLNDALDKLIGVVAQNSTAQENVVNDPRVVSLIKGIANQKNFGPILDARDRPGPEGPQQIQKLMKLLNPVHSTDELRATIPHFDSLSVEKKRELETTIAREQAHPVLSGLITPTPTGAVVGGTGKIALPRNISISPAAFQGGGGITIENMTIQVTGNDNPDMTARKVAREFEKRSNRIVRQRRGSRVGGILTR